MIWNPQSVVSEPNSRPKLNVLIDPELLKNLSYITVVQVINAKQ